MRVRERVNFDNIQEIYTDYHRRYLWNFLLNLFKWEGFPDTVNVRYFNDKLLADGFAPVFKYIDGRILCSDGAISGLDHYYRPTRFQSANPVLKAVKRDISYIDEIKENQCVVCFNTGEYQQPETMGRIVEIFAWKLAQIDLSMDTSIMNSRVCLIPVVNDDKEAVRVSKILKQMYEGKPSVLSYKTSFDKGIELTPISARDNIVTAELEDAKRNVFQEFLRRIGVDTVAVDKKERTNLAEMDSNAQELYISGNVYLNARKDFCEVYNKTFGGELSVEFDKEVMSDYGISDGQSELDNEFGSQSEMGDRQRDKSDAG